MECRSSAPTTSCEEAASHLNLARVRAYSLTWTSHQNAGEREAWFVLETGFAQFSMQVGIAHRGDADEEKRHEEMWAANQNKPEKYANPK
jgi:hypothetical protein